MSNLDDRLERGGAAVRRMAEAVPLAPPDLAVEAIRAGGRRPPIGLIAVASLTLVVALAATFLFLGPNRGSDMVGPDPTATSVLRAEPDIRITLSEDTTDEVLERAVAAVTALDGVSFAQGLNRDAAFAEFSELFADCPGLVEVASQDLSAFPIAIKVWVDVDANAEDRSEIVDVANRVLTVMMASEFGLVDIELTRDTPPAENDCVSPTTTMAVPAELEQAGVDLVEEITADGYVTRDEFVRAVEGMAACMTDHGLTGVNWAVDELWATGGQGGGWSMGYDSPTDDAAEQAIYALCYHSYIPQMELRGEPPTPEIAPLSPVRVTCSAELSESFPCSALLDGDPNTTWQAPDGGIGVTITILFASPVQITDVTFENEGGDAYIRNARVRGVAVMTDDLAAMITFELSDTNEAAQQFEIRSLRTSEVTIEITSAYPGQSFGDQAPFSELALGEITFRGRLGPDDRGTGDESRWEWILAHSEPTGDENLRVADPAASPLPTFDYAGLGVEQPLVATDPAIPSFYALGDPAAIAPWVYVGTVSDAVSGYVFHSDNGPVSVQDLPGTALGVVCVQVALAGADLVCNPDVESLFTDGIISGIHGLVSPDLPQGDIAVSLWLPLDTAVVVLNLDDGRSFVQRPVGGVSIFVISDLGDAGIESAEALDASGHRMFVEDFSSYWEALVASLDPSPRSEFPDAVEVSSELVIGSVYVAELPEVATCGSVPQQGGAVSNVGVFPTPTEVLAAFLSHGIGNPPIARSGYIELIELDGTITFGKNTPVPGPDDVFVTLISIEPSGAGWTVSAWEASGC